MNILFLRGAMLNWLIVCDLSTHSRIFHSFFYFAMVVSSYVKVWWCRTSSLFLEKSRCSSLCVYLIGSTGVKWNKLRQISHCVNKTGSSWKWKVKIVHPLNSDWKGRSDWLENNNKLTSQAPSSTTFKLFVVKG